MSYETVIGLEVHVQLATRSKLFSGSANDIGGEPNTRANAVDLGLPGVLPVLNENAVRMAVMFALAVGAEIGRRSVFARKHYFYPDLPKGYQISQYELPIVMGGSVLIEERDGRTSTVRLTRAHLEEDAGKSLHENYADVTGIDLNRAGTPLIEVVSEPDMRSPAQAVACMRKIHSIVRYLGISDGNMQHGSLRCDANVSLRPFGQSELGTRTEIKNLNSFRFLERAIIYEVERQQDLLDAGQEIVQETRLYDPELDETRSMRSKEEANDYRYFPDPDLLPVVITDDYIESIRASMPELPHARRARMAQDYGLKDNEAAQLSDSRELADYFEAVAAAARAGVSTPGEHARSDKLSANWVLGDLAARMNRESLDTPQAAPVSPQALGKLVSRIVDGTISATIARDVLDAMWNGEGEADRIIESRGLEQVSDSSELDALVDKAIADHPDQVDQFRAGKHKVLGFLVGQIMKASGGKANPKQINELLRKRLTAP
ncbi:MAG: Asp-tRNA(Asn)/Glu-tRNA(Gln) amidotransferase subunit GatB [Gammaproteobacteria bacterium]